MKKIGVIILVVVSLLCLGGGAVKAVLFGSTCQVTGTIYLYGRLADQGMTVQAYVGDHKVAESKVQDQGKFAFTLADSNPADTVHVKLAGKDAKPTFTPDKDQIKITLSVEQSLDVKLSTWGKIKALFK